VSISIRRRPACQLNDSPPYRTAGLPVLDLHRKIHLTDAEQYTNIYRGEVKRSRRGDPIPLLSSASVGGHMDDHRFVVVSWSVWVGLAGRKEGLVATNYFRSNGYGFRDRFIMTKFYLMDWTGKRGGREGVSDQRDVDRRGHDAGAFAASVDISVIRLNTTFFSDVAYHLFHGTT